MKYAILLSIFLVGCASDPVVKIVKEIEYKYVDIPNNLLVPVRIPEPPAKEFYLSLKTIDREIILADYSSKLMAGLYSCNYNLTQIRNFNKEIKERFEQGDR